MRECLCACTLYSVPPVGECRGTSVCLPSSTKPQVLFHSPAPCPPILARSLALTTLHSTHNLHLLHLLHLTSSSSFLTLLLTLSSSSCLSVLPLLLPTSIHQPHLFSLSLSLSLPLILSFLLAFSLSFHLPRSPPLAPSILSSSSFFLLHWPGFALVSRFLLALR